MVGLDFLKLGGVICLYAFLFWMIIGSPSQKAAISFFVPKKWKCPAGKFSCIGYGSENPMKSLKGETLDDMFERREQILKDRIKNSRPTMDYNEYVAITTDKAEDRYRMDVGKVDSDGGAAGAVLERKEDGNFMLTLYNLKIV